MSSLNKLAASAKFNLNRINKNLIPGTLAEFIALTTSSNKKLYLLGLDIGKMKCGVAISDDLQNVAIPLDIVATKFLTSYLENINRQICVSGFIIGLPLTTAGNLGSSSVSICTIINEMADFINKTNSPIWLHDERYSTTASYSLFKSKKSSPKLVDDLCAMKILQEHLDSRKVQGPTRANDLQR